MGGKRETTRRTRVSMRSFSGAATSGAPRIRPTERPRGDRRSPCRRSGCVCVDALIPTVGGPCVRGSRWPPRLRFPSSRLRSKLARPWDKAARTCRIALRSWDRRAGTSSGPEESSGWEVAVAVTHDF
uniref:Uncharacterized protein n=1 Tax=Human herpesvirus 1 TaxID=10298 RepID=A0A8E4LH41_HHV1|nr:hypothetical protein HSV-1_88 [Human alphaherpesvirus 1]